MQFSSKDSVLLKTKIDKQFLRFPFVQKPWSFSFLLENVFVILVLFLITDAIRGIFSRALEIIDFSCL